MEPPRVRKPKKRTNLTEVLPEDLDEGRQYLIESYCYTNFDAEQFKGIFLGSTTIGASDPPLIISSFKIKKFPLELDESFRKAGTHTATQDFSSDRTRYYLALADEIMLAKVIEANTNLDVGPTIAKGFYREPKRPKKGDTKTKKTTGAKKGGTKTKTKTKTKRTT